MFKKLFGWGKKEEKIIPKPEDIKEEYKETIEDNFEEKAEETVVEKTEEKTEKFKSEIEYEVKNEVKELQTHTEAEEDNSEQLEEEIVENFETTSEKTHIEEQNINSDLEEDDEIQEELFKIEKDDVTDEIGVVGISNDPDVPLQKIELDENFVDENSKIVSKDEIDILQKEEEKKQEDEPKGFFARLKAGLSKTTKNFTDKLTELFECYEGVSELVYEDLEEILIMADVGFETTNYIVETLRNRVLDKTISDTALVKVELQQIISEILSKESAQMNINDGPSIVTIVGVNGVGKTTTIGKLANKYKNNGKKVILAAADTFRAAASEQLDIWAKRAEVEIVKHKEGADPSAVIFDGIKAAKARQADILICDTAGRLHNKKNLMMELEKIFRIIDREYEEANKEVLLVIDATTGQNAISQAKLFKEVAPLTGIILTKLDGTAKGGVVLGIIQELGLPVKYIGVGEKLDDLQEFDSQSFARALFGED